MPTRQQRFVALVKRLQRNYPDVEDPVAAIAAGRVLVDGVIVTNPHGLVRHEATISLRRAAPLRGAEKLDAAFDDFGLSVQGAVALDIGASTGGFTSVLLSRGARCVYAVDAGFGQLLGSLRQDPRVVNLERTNVAALSPLLIDQPVDVVTMDLSYLALAAAVPELTRIEWRPGAQLVALVKPMYELGLARPPEEESERQVAVVRASGVMEQCGWSVQGSIRSPITGRRGAVEYFLHARRSEGPR